MPSANCFQQPIARHCPAIQKFRSEKLRITSVCAVAHCFYRSARTQSQRCALATSLILLLAHLFKHSIPRSYPSERRFTVVDSQFRQLARALTLLGVAVILPAFPKH